MIKKTLPTKLAAFKNHVQDLDDEMNKVVCILRVDTLCYFLQGRYLLPLPVCFPAHQIPTEKESTIKRKNLPQMGANSFFLK